MSQLIFDALGKMDDRTAVGAGLVPPGGGRLELYVPATDLDGFDVLVPSGAGGASNRDRQHAQVFEFCSAEGPIRQVAHRRSRVRGAGIGELSRCIRPDQSGVVQDRDGQGDNWTFHHRGFPFPVTRVDGRGRREKV